MADALSYESSSNEEDIEPEIFTDVYGVQPYQFEHTAPCTVPPPSPSDACVSFQAVRHYFYRYDARVWICEHCGKPNDQDEYNCQGYKCPGVKPYDTTPVQDPVEVAAAEKDTLIADLCRTCGIDNGIKRARNIVFLGRPGAGKSSLINSFAAPLGDEWYPYARAAPQVKGKPTTIHIRRFPKCCMDVTLEEPNARLERYREKYREYLLPLFLDVAGLNDEAEVPMKKFLTLLLYGHIKEEAKTIKVYEDCETLSDAELQEKYKECYEDMRVDVVVFVASVSDPLPVKLMECVADIAGSSHSEEAARAVPVFGVLTKKDEKEQPDSQEMLDLQETFKGTLGLDDDNFVFCSCFCSKLFPRAAPLTRQRLLQQHDINVPLLNFLTQMCDPRSVVIRPDEPMPFIVMEDQQANTEQIDTEPDPTVREKNSTWWIAMNSFVSDLMAALFFSVVFFVILQVVPRDGTLEQYVDAACKDEVIRNTNTTAHIERLCQRSENIKFYSQLWADLFPVAIVFVQLLLFLQLRRVPLTTG